jgi:hypothetical protein
VGQLISVSLTPGREDELERLAQMIHDVEPAGSGLLHAMAMRDQGSDPGSPTPREQARTA